MWRIFGVLCMGTFFLCSDIAKAQNVYGPQGLLLNPTAYTLPKGQWIPSVMTREQDMLMAKGLSPHTHRVEIIGVDYGLMKRTEVGVFATLIHGDLSYSPTYGVFAKYALVEEGGSRPQMALGSVWAPTSHWRTQFLFAALSKRLTPENKTWSVHGHGGVTAPFFLNGMPTSGLETYGGIDIGFWDRIKLIGELRSKTSMDVGLPSSIGLVFTYGRGHTLAVGFVNDGMGHKNQLSIGAGFSLGALD